MTAREMLERGRQLNRQNSYVSDSGSEPDRDPEDIVADLCKDMLAKGVGLKSLESEECVSPLPTSPALASVLSSCIASSFLPLTRP